MIYLDNAATTLHKPQCVIDAVAAAMGSMGNSARGTHNSAMKSARTVYDARCALSDLLGFSHPERLVFTANATEALNIAINGLIAPGDHVITTDLEHNSVLRPLYRLQAEQDVSLSFVPAYLYGNVDHRDFERLIKPETKAIVCTHASNLTGNLLDIRRISTVARAHGLLLIVDASQTAGCYPINMGELGIDILCFTGHKGLMGPQGTGGLCVRPGVEIRPFKVGGSGVQSYNRFQPSEMPTRLEAGTLNSHGIAGLGAAAGYIAGVGIDVVHRKEIDLAKRFYTGVSKIPGIKIYGDFSTWQRAPIVALNIGEYDSGEVSDALSQDYGIATRPGAHCAPRLHEALGTKEQGAVRFSFSCFNTETEVDEAVRAVTELSR
ncbi:MAG: aminotransferase class V-fold PLP-dependent enzyme [Bacillota bacterium]|nr:aminotransferase class V-fold PLP-dependent enzyme [Bacillota bacterium]